MQHYQVGIHWPTRNDTIFANGCKKEQNKTETPESVDQ